MSITVERRKDPRQKLFLVMEINQHAQNPEQQSKINVITNNISAGGVYFKTAKWQQIAVGDDVDFTIFMSVPIAGKNWHMNKLQGKAKVIRHQELPVEEGHSDAGHWCGIALKFDSPLVIS